MVLAFFKRFVNRVNHWASQEYILCAANHYDDGKVYQHQPKNIEFGIVVAGRRHHNCIITVAILSKKDWRRDSIAEGMKETQGFLTNRDRFVNRHEAYMIATSSGQLSEDPHLSSSQTLLSEDIY